MIARKVFRRSQASQWVGETRPEADVDMGRKRTREQALLSQFHSAVIRSVLCLHRGGVLWWTVCLAAHSMIGGQPTAAEMRFGGEACLSVWSAAVQKD